MKELLVFGGALLYIAFSLVTFPLLVLTHCILETWAAVKYLRSVSPLRSYLKSTRRARLPYVVHSS